MRINSPPISEPDDDDDDDIDEPDSWVCDCEAEGLHRCGWDVFDNDVYGPEIQKDDMSRRFEGDDEAAFYVLNQACRYKDPICREAIRELVRGWDAEESRDGPR